MNIYLLFLFDISNETQTLGQQKQSIVLGAFFIFAYFCIENKDEYGKSETFNIGFPMTMVSLQKALVSWLSFFVRWEK